MVEARNLTKTYHRGLTEVRALRGVDMTVEEGEFLSVMGRSGSGKSTLLNLLGCLDRPTEGTVFINGVEVTALPRRKLPRIRQQMVGFVFQQFNLLPGLTALENVMLPLRYSHVSRAEGRRHAIELLEKAGLGDRYTHRPMEMSGGEQQRVAVARALINRPAIVLADEPTGELDTHTAAEIMTLLHNLNQTQGQTFIIVTHDPAAAEKTERTIYLSDGMVLREERRG
ncbi:MAG: macrolide ABC transporter ATP-binding protein [Anaerolineaceae bacterium 4572_32.1]|nr:MAG: macrolide ABC transporter ATP-binding protein [Anaerolineaceae bacterium 4572_32.1]